MKILMSVLLASAALVTLATLTAADISLNQGYNYPVQQQPMYPLSNNLQQHQPLIMQILNGPLQQQAGLQQQGSILKQYLPAVGPQYAQRYPQQQQNHQNMLYPMPLSFPAVPNFQPLKSARRSRPRVKISKKPIVTKNFFIHAAPEESEDEIQEELAQLAQQPRKHYNVLFVKTPAQTSKAAAINLAKALKEEKTVVYVLSKKTSAADLQDAIAEAPQHINKPDVFFIKYRTPEEAANAQHQIQSQYDSLGGTSTITDEGYAPVTSVVGSLDAPEPEDVEEEQLDQQKQQEQGGQQYDEQLVNTINNIGNAAGGGSANNQYLPPSQY